MLLAWFFHKLEIKTLPWEFPLWCSKLRIWLQHYSVEAGVWFLTWNRGLKDLVLLQLQLRFNSWPKTTCCRCSHFKKKKTIMITLISKYSTQPEECQQPTRQSSMTTVLVSSSLAPLLPLKGWKAREEEREDWGKQVWNKLSTSASYSQIKEYFLNARS